MYFIITIICFLYIICDFNYFLRSAFTVISSRFYEKKCGLNDTTTIYGFCTTQDIDILVYHMNNARFVREIDFARYHFYDRSGIYDNIKKIGDIPLHVASCNRYRKSIPIFTAYKIETKMVCWEEKTFVMEHKFITLNDGFVRAVVFSRQSFQKYNLDINFKGLPGADQKPECPEEIKHWLRAIEITSAKLRKKD